MTDTLSIDIRRLEKVRYRGHKLQARCPACSSAGGDRSGDHLFVNLETGAWGCAAFPGEAEHRREIFRLVGVVGERQRDPERDRQWRENRLRERREAEERQALAEAARSRRKAIVERWEWDPADVWESSPQRIDQPLVELDARHFLQSLFPPEALVWTGEVYHSGQSHANHWKTVENWLETPQKEVGPMVAPAIWQPGTVSRNGDNVLAAPYVVLDFDELDGKQPESAQEIEEHKAASLAITRWMREGLHWRLAAIIATGGKSLHAWFHHPGKEALKSLEVTSNSLGIDTGLIGHPEHPCRLPGQIHAKSGQMSHVIWLQNNPNEP